MINEIVKKKNFPDLATSVSLLEYIEKDLRNYKKLDRKSQTLVSNLMSDDGFNFMGFFDGKLPDFEMHSYCYHIIKYCGFKLS